MQLQRVFFLLCLSLLLCAVAVFARPFNVPIPKPSSSRSSTEQTGGYAHLFESFNTKNDPSSALWSAAGVTTLNFDAMKTSGQAARAPWPGSYWPASQDSINYRWAGASSMSPASKYARAFLSTAQSSGAQLNDVMQKFEDSVSAHHGIGLDHSAQQCSRDRDCSGAQTCGMRTMVNAVEQQRTGYCIDGWAGICHGWAPAAIYEPEPQRSVAYNGVLFKIPDIKALLSAAYTSAQSLALGFLCATQGGSGDELDAAGRIIDVTCRDVNPGAWHVVIANMLGAGKSLIEDRTYDLQIWNQPIKGFTSSSKDIEFSQAHAKLNLGSGVPATSFYFNDKAARLKLVSMRLEYVAECASADSGVLAGRFSSQDVYEYIVELDARGTVIGGEWSAEAQRNHPDFIWTLRGFGPVPVDDLKMADVQFINNLTQIAVGVNVCATNNGGCDAKATCSSSVQADYLAVTCQCRTGYVGNGRQCTGSEPSNACATNNGGCPTNSTCSLDTTTRQVVCTCQQAGFFWNRAVQPSVCADINECAQNNGGCAQLCTNTRGAFTCSCNTGYTQSGTMCVDINECLNPNACPAAHSTCVNSPGSFECQCQRGYVHVTPSSAACTPEQPPVFKNCSDRASNTCDPTTSTCVDTGPGAYYCKCLTNYVSWTNERGKQVCVPVNACATNNGGCHVRASCSRLFNGAVQCTCMPGLLGDGHLCYPEHQRPVVLDMSRCKFNPNCPAFGVSNNTLGEAMREEQHVMLLFKGFSTPRTTASSSVQPVLNCQFACPMPITQGWTVALKSCTLRGTATVSGPGGALRGYVDMWLSGDTPGPPALAALVTNTASAPLTTAFTVQSTAKPGDWTRMQGTCSGEREVLLRGWMALQFSGGAGSTVSVNSVDAVTGEYDWNGAGFVWQMEWKKC